ncbi:MAG: thiamine diphosphokinase [Prevotellaceae bacterium]|jgi:thiamine pyrophosphokinase|nr:thiamine diphosphokinase [Prevotellaceae bacterium]
MEPFALVVANGDYPTHPAALDAMRRAAYTVCCDGGADAYLADGRLPDAIVGDGDSLSAANRIKYAALLHCFPDQETNDQTKAVRFLQQQGHRRIVIVGATGKREDHTLGNISLLLEYMHQGVRVEMLTDYGRFIPCCNTATFATCAGQQVSLFNFGARGLRAQGLRYPLRDFTSWWQGTLNEALGTELTVHAQGDYLLFLEHPTGETVP